MYQCTRCGADVQHPNQLCHACRRTHERSSTSTSRAQYQRESHIDVDSSGSVQNDEPSHHNFNDFDTILSIRGPQDFTPQTDYEATEQLVSPVNQTPQIILAEPDRTEINSQPPTYEDQSSPHEVMSRINLLDYQRMAEEPIFDQTITEDPEEYEQMGLMQYTDVIDDQDFSDFSASIETEISDLPSVVLEAIESQPPMISSDSTPVPPPSPSVGGWLNIPNPFSAKSSSESHSKYYVINLASSGSKRVKPQLISPAETFSLFGTRVSWQTISQAHFIVQAERLQAPIKSHKIWMNLDQGSKQDFTLKPSILYRCGDWYFTIQPLQWETWDGQTDLAPVHLPHYATDPYGSSISASEAIDAQSAHEDQESSVQLSLIVYRDKALHDETRSAHLKAQQVMSAQMELFGVFPLKTSAVTRVGGNLCEIVLPSSSARSSSEGPLFSLEVSSESDVIVSPILAQFWRALSSGEQVEFGTILALDHYLFSIVNLG